MKIHITSIFSALAFSMLFYSKSVGLNILLISIIATVLLFSQRKERPFPWPYAVAYLFTAFMVFAEPSGFHLFIYILTLLVFAGKSIAMGSSVYVSGFIGLVNQLVASMVNLSERQKLPREERKSLSPKTFTYLKGAGIAAVLLFFFGILYRNANPVFEALVTDIDLSFISIPWLCCTLAGYLLFFHFLKPYRPTALIEVDEAQNNELKAPSEAFSTDILNNLSNEHTLGSIVFAALNLLLLFFLVTDIIYLLDPDILSNADYSSSVHKGVYALMFSIVCAIAVILYFFRGDLNFFEENKSLKQLSYLWIALNTVLVTSTLYKNLSYVTALGLTYKRIGVFFYLLFVLFGLITTYIKVSKKRSFIYLLRTNTSLVFVFLVFCSAIPWDRAITYYNLNYIERPDISYLMDLRWSNTELLYDYSQEQPDKFPEDLAEFVENRLKSYREEQAAKSWQEITLYQLYTKENH